MKKNLLATLGIILFIATLLSCNNDDDDGGIVIDCTNGVQDGSETGVDCGGQCSPCLVTQNTRNSFSGIFKEETFSFAAEEDNYRGTNTSGLSSNCAVTYANTIRRFVDGALDTKSPGVVIFFEDIDLNDYNCSIAEGYPEYFNTGKQPLDQPGHTGFEIKIDWTDADGVFWFSNKVAQEDEHFFEIYNIEKVNNFNVNSPLIIEGALNVFVENDNQEVEVLQGDFNIFVER